MMVVGVLVMAVMVMTVTVLGDLFRLRVAHHQGLDHPAHRILVQRLVRGKKSGEPGEHD
jgi:hypothetical protein